MRPPTCIQVLIDVIAGHHQEGRYRGSGVSHTCPLKGVPLKLEHVDLVSDACMRCSEGRCRLYCRQLHKEAMMDEPH
jgi:hypothetical protein